MKLAYDPKFKGVKYPSYIPSKADRHYWVKSKKTIRFKPSLDCPLTNISGQWDNPNRSMASRLLGAVAAPVTDVVMSDAVGVATLERLSELACLSELSDEARQYVFDSGYKSALIARLARENSRFSRSEIETALAG